MAVLLWRHPIYTVLVSLAASLAIELIQPVTGIGANDVIDLLANTVGAVLGALTALTILLIRDAVDRRPITVARVLRIAIGVLAVGAVMVGYPAWVTEAKQASGAARLERMFAGTTLADYQINRDSAWQDKLLTFTADSGPLTSMAYRTDQVARERFTWTS